MGPGQAAELPSWRPPARLHRLAENQAGRIDRAAPMASMTAFKPLLPPLLKPPRGGFGGHRRSPFKAQTASTSRPKRPARHNAFRPRNRYRPAWPTRPQAPESRSPLPGIPPWPIYAAPWPELRLSPRAATPRVLYHAFPYSRLCGFLHSQIQRFALRRPGAAYSGKAQGVPRARVNGAPVCQRGGALDSPEQFRPPSDLGGNV